MSNDNQATEFEQRVRELLRDSADSLDAATRSRLTQARHAALEQRSSGVHWPGIRRLASGGAVAAVALAALLLWNGRGQNPGTDSAAPLADLEMLADADGYELSQEPDLDFIEWAAAMSERDPTDI